MRAGFYEPGGAFRHWPAVLIGVHDPECETIEMRVRIADRHDAVLTASSADPACLFMKSPCKITAPLPAMPCYLWLFRPFCVPCYDLRDHDTAALPLDRLTIDLAALTIFSRNKLPPPGSN
jgi:hypothetical protein